MKVIDVGTALACLGMMTACPSSDTSGDDAGSAGARGRDSATSASDASNSSGGHDDATAAACTPALGRFMGASCQTCLQDNCQAHIASCTFDNCVRCLLDCTACESACTSASVDSGAGAEAGKTIANDGGDASGVGDGGAASCEKITSGNCCSFASFAGLGNQCQQATASNVESICATLLSNLQSFGVCR